MTEANRRLLTQVTTVHLAAAPLAAMNLLDERVAGGDVLLTGNTAVDAAAVVGPRRDPYADPALATLRDPGTNRLLVVNVGTPAGSLEVSCSPPYAGSPHATPTWTWSCSGRSRPAPRAGSSADGR